jgi:hypothetical protein
VASNHPSSPVVTIAFYLAMEVSCYQFFLGSLIAIMSMSCYSGVYYLLVLPGIQLSAQDVEFVCIDFQVIIAKLLKDPSKLSNCH